MKTLSSSIFAYLSTLLVVNIKLVVFALLLTLLAGTGTVATYYATTGKPITSLPGIRALAKGVAPRYLTSVVGPARPVSVALSPDGSRIYVTQTGGSRTTLVYDNLFNPLGELEPPNTTDANRQPLYAAVDRDGLVYVSDVLRGLVDVYNPDNSYKMPLSIGSETIGATSPLAVTFSRDGELMVSEGRPPHRMFTVDKGGGQIKSAWGTTDTSGTAGGEMSYPNGMAEDKKGRYYGADGNNGRITMFRADGEFILAFAVGEGEGSVGLPRGLAIDDLGRLHIVDAASHQVVVYDVNGDEPKYLYSFGGFGVGNGEFNYPAGIALDTKGRVFVADSFNRRVQVWTY